MDKDEKILVKIFDGTGFSVWKYHMEIVFEAKGILEVVKGLEKMPTFHTAITDDRPFIEAEQTRILDWNKKNAKGRMLISNSIS
jgi:hypothetical protein